MLLAELSYPCFKLKRMKGRYNSFSTVPTLYNSSNSFPIFCSMCFSLGLLKNGRNISRKRPGLWKMSLVGRLVKVSTTLDDGCLLQVVSFVPKFGKIRQVLLLLFILGVLDMSRPLVSSSIKSFLTYGLVFLANNKKYAITFTCVKFCDTVCNIVFKCVRRPLPI